MVVCRIVAASVLAALYDVRANPPVHRDPSDDHIINVD